MERHTSIGLRSGHCSRRRRANAVLDIPAGSCLVSFFATHTHGGERGSADWSKYIHPPSLKYKKKIIVSDMAHLHLSRPFFPSLRLALPAAIFVRLPTRFRSPSPPLLSNWPIESIADDRQAQQKTMGSMAVRAISYTCSKRWSRLRAFCQLRLRIPSPPSFLLLLPFVRRRIDLRSKISLRVMPNKARPDSPSRSLFFSTWISFDDLIATPEQRDLCNPF